MSGQPPEERLTDAIDETADAAEVAIEETAQTVQQKVAEAGTAAQERVRRTAATAQDGVRRTSDQVTSKVRETEATLRRNLASVQDGAGELKGLSEPTPARDVGHAVKQAAELRRAIDRDLDALQARMPPGEELADKARKVGGVAIAVGGVLAALAIRSKQQGERKRIERESKAHAAAIARYLPQASATPRPEPSGGGKGKFVVFAAIVAAVVAFVASQQDEDEPDIWGPAD